MKRISILGSTGSIGKQTLEVVSRYPGEITVMGLAARRNRLGLADQLLKYSPRWAVLTDPTLPITPGISSGDVALTEMVTHPDVDLVVVAMVGAAGLKPTLDALRAGKMVALANKEALVMGGSLIRDELQYADQLVPIDSEHSAIWQCLQGEPASGIEKLLLTASGGAFRDLPLEELQRVTPEQAREHPNWVMGQKVTIDSATLMNKGLEVIEASILFGIDIRNIEVILHRESIVHSFVYFKDSSVKAQLGLPDMRVPIQYALTHPNRWENSLERLDLTRWSSLHFSEVDMTRYPCLELAIRAAEMGGTCPAALCAADEIAVEQFVAGAIPFTGIPDLIRDTLSRHAFCPDPDLDDIISVDRVTREDARALASTHAHSS